MTDIQARLDTNSIWREFGKIWKTKPGTTHCGASGSWHQIDELVRLSKLRPQETQRLEIGRSQATPYPFLYLEHGTWNHDISLRWSWQTITWGKDLESSPHANRVSLANRKHLPLNPTPFLSVYIVPVHMEYSTQLILLRIIWEWLFYRAVTREEEVSPKAFIASSWTFLASQTHTSASVVGPWLPASYRPTCLLFWEL